MKVKGITIHNTGNEKSASEIYEELKSTMKTNICHYLVDEKETINNFPEDMEAWHTGRGYDFGNRYTIAIEICRSTCEDDVYFPAQDRAVDLIRSLMDKYKLTEEDIYFHCDFNTIKCPHRILEAYETKRRFIDECIVQSRKRANFGRKR